MNSANVRLLIEAARSGKYRQTYGQLADGEGGYCFLGLACEVYRQHEGLGEWVGKFFLLNGDEYIALLPGEVRAWFDFTHDQSDELMDLNDDLRMPLDEMSGKLEEWLSQSEEKAA